MAADGDRVQAGGDLVLRTGRDNASVTPGSLEQRHAIGVHVCPHLYVARERSLPELELRLRHEQLGAPEQADVSDVVPVHVGDQQSRNLRRIDAQPLERLRRRGKALAPARDRGRRQKARVYDDHLVAVTQDVEEEVHVLARVGLAIGLVAVEQLALVRSQRAVADRDDLVAQSEAPSAASTQRAISVWSAPAPSASSAWRHIASARCASAAGIPSSSPSDTAIPTSLTMSERAKPALKVAGRMNSASLRSVEALRPVDTLIVSTSTFGSRPNSRPIASASQLASRCTAESMLLRALRAWPAPTSPTWRTLLPIASSNGRQASTASSLPPAMIVSVPSTAPRTPPETGASTSSIPRAAARCASSRVSSGSEELMSISATGASSASSRPSSSTSTA